MAFSKICDRPVRGKIHRDDARGEEQRFPGGTGRHRGRPTGSHIFAMEDYRLPTGSMVLVYIYANIWGTYGYIDGKCYHI